MNSEKNNLNLSRQKTPVIILIALTLILGLTSGILAYQHNQVKKRLNKKEQSLQQLRNKAQSLQQKINKLEQKTTGTRKLTLESIRNAEYNLAIHSPEGEIYRLKDGYYEEKYKNVAGKFSIEIYEDKKGEKIAYGDLNEDGKEDAAVILIYRSGGSGSFRQLCILLNQNGKPKHIATKGLGDRVIAHSIKIDSGIIILDMNVHGPNDGLCCPSLRKVFKYRLSGDKLQLISEEKIQ